MYVLVSSLWRRGDVARTGGVYVGIAKKDHPTLPHQKHQLGCQNGLQRCTKVDKTGLSAGLISAGRLIHLLVNQCQTLDPALSGSLVYANKDLGKVFLAPIAL